MTSESTTRWPLLEERAPFATATQRRMRRRVPRSTLLLTGLAFICGGLVSAAAFSIGWRHQAQRDTAAQTALATATARAHTLEGRIAALQASLATVRRTKAEAKAAAAAAAASTRDLARTGTKVAGDAAASRTAAATLSSGAGSLTGASGRIASELKTLDTYLTTTPTDRLDAGYIASQTAYLSQQLTRLEGEAGALGRSVKSFQAAVRKLTREARALRAH
jgi:chromosome segregation ATPase